MPRRRMTAAAGRRDDSSPDMGTTVYSAEFFRRHRDGSRRSAEVIVPLMLTLAPSLSVIDVGCGLATWLAVFREHGIDDVFGIDGDYINRTELAIPEELFRGVDLAQPFELERRFDLVTCLEVAEHLPAESARGFVGSLAALGPVVLFSAAVPFQGGEKHLNEQWPDYWAALFAEHDYVAVDCVRRKVWQDDRVEWWYAQNAIVYLKRAAIEAYPLLQRELELAQARPLAVVHPKLFMEWVEWCTHRYSNSPEAPRC